MSNLRIHLHNDSTRFRPGDRIRGIVFWQLSREPKVVELRLFWRTEGLGQSDVRVVEKVRFNQPGAEESRPFEFRLPRAPYSFSGRLFALRWALELGSRPAREWTRLEFTLSPTGEEVRLSREAGPE